MNDRERSETDERLATSRYTLGAAGLLALAAIWLPFLLAGNVYGAIVAPAYRLPAQPAAVAPDGLVAIQRGGWEAAHGERLVENPDATLSGAEGFALGMRLAADADELPSLRAETRIVGRFLTLSVAALALFALAALTLPWVRSTRETWVNVAIGALAMWLFATHVLTLGLDVVGIVEGGLFAWPHHVVAAGVVVLTAIGTSTVLRADNALRVIGGTLAGFVALGVASSIWLIA